MAYNRRKEERLDTEGIISRISGKYYHDQIEELDERISSILSGNGDRCRGYQYTSSEHLDTQAKRDKKVSELRKKINQLKEKASEVADLRSALDTAAYKYETLAEKDALHYTLWACLSEYLTYERKLADGKKEKINSETHEELFKSGFIRRSKVGRVHCKDTGEIRHSKEKIDKTVYDKLKKRKSLWVTDGHLTSSIEGLIVDNGYSVEHFGPRMYSEQQKDYYGYPYNKNIENLGVKLYDLEEAKKIMKDPNYLESVGCNTYREIEAFINSNIYVSSISSKLYKFRDRFNQLQMLERETEAVDYIVSAFSNTAISNSYTMNYLREYLSDRRRELRKEENDLLKDYDKSKVKEVIESEKKLRELYHDYIMKMNDYNRLDKDRRYDDPELSALRDEIAKIRFEMITIVRKYPELNKPIYKIDLEKYKKRVKDIEDELVPKPRVERVVDATPVVEPRVTEPKVAIEDPVRRAPVEEATVAPVVPKAGDGIKRGEAKQPGKIERVEVPDDLKTNRTARYQAYMVEKMKKTDLGKLKFSEYLEETAPFLTDLIAIEQEREARAATVYKLYLQYLVTVPNKNNAMSFNEFAQVRFGFEPVDIPVEYDEMEAQRKMS